MTGSKFTTDSIDSDNRRSTSSAVVFMLKTSTTYQSYVIFNLCVNNPEFAIIVITCAVISGIVIYRVVISAWISYDKRLKVNQP